jgi:hypothetical protein
MLKESDSVEFVCLHAYAGEYMGGNTGEAICLLAGVF